MKAIIVRSFCILAAGLMLSGCSKKFGEGVTLKDIEPGPDVRVLLDATGVRAYAYPIPWDCTDYDFTWESADPSICTVDKAGFISPKSPGTTTLYVSSGSIRKEVHVEIYELSLQEKMAKVGGFVGLWEFEDASNFEKATVGKNLITYLRESNGVLGTPSTAGLSAVAGFNATDHAVQIGHQSLFFCDHGIAATTNGKVGEYTLMFDICRPEGEGGYATLLNTSITNSDDQDVAIKNEGTIGVGTSGYSTNAMARNKWYRVFVVLKAGSYYRIYVNGEKWLEGSNNNDDRFKLDPQGTLLMGDEDSDDHTMYLSTVAAFSRAIDESEILTLSGGVSAWR